MEILHMYSQRKERDILVLDVFGLQVRENGEQEIESERWMDCVQESIQAFTLCEVET